MSDIYYPHSSSTNHSSYTAFDRVVDHIRKGIRPSGKSLKTISSSSLSHLPQFQYTQSVLDLAYCVAHSLDEPPRCFCGVTLTLINAKRGFRKYCSLSCATEKLSASNKTGNVTRNKQRGEIIHTKWKVQCEQAFQFYMTQLTATIAEVAKKFNIPHHALRVYIHEQRTLGRVVRNKKHKYAQKFLATHPNLNDAEYLTQQARTRTLEETASDIGVSPNTVRLYAQRLGIAYINKNITQPEREIESFLQSHQIRTEFHNRSTLSTEIDIWLPDYNIGIEYNGLYWHTEDRIGKRYHYEKQILAEQAQVTLVQIFEHEWRDRRKQFESLLLSKILPHTSSGARKCTVVKITPEQGKTFLNDYHCHGSAPASLYYGLVLQNELVSVCSFRKPRFTTLAEYELIRLASKPGISISGGLSKMISFAQRELQMESCISYVHRRLFDGRSYLASGFTLHHTTPPGYFWYKCGSGDMLTRYQTQMKNETAIMKSRGYSRIWDCGQKVFLRTWNTNRESKD